MITLAGLRRYPVKSCRGEDLAAAEIEPWGLAGDRRWMLVDETGEKVTAREVHRLVLVVPELVPGGLRLTAPGREPLVVAEPGHAEPGHADAWVHIWDDDVLAADAGDQAAAWFTAIAGKPVRLMFLDDPRRRPVDPRHAHPGDTVTFADAYPMLLASLGSLAQLNEWVATVTPEQEPLDIRRFRPNLVVDGAEPFAEDTWSRIRVGGEGGPTFRVTTDCSRCVLTTVHPDTAERGHEPIKTLSRHRRWEGKVWFAVNLIPETPGATLTVGDPVEVIETRAASRPAPPDPARPAA